MSIDRRLWKEKIYTTHSPQWPCPACHSHYLALEQSTLHFAETEESRRRAMCSEEGLFPDDVKYTFSAQLACTNEGCKQIVSCCGHGGIYIWNYHDENGEDQDHLDEFFVPEYFWPPLLLFHPPLNCPKAAKHHLRLSFRTFFCDLGASANHIRSCIDEVLTDRKISRKSKKGRWLPLDNRIEEFKNVDQNNAAFASALKWIGNFGSHPGELKTDDLFDSYDIIESLLEDIYVGHRRKTADKVAQINRLQNPLSTKP